MSYDGIVLAVLPSSCSGHFLPRKWTKHRGIRRDFGSFAKEQLYVPIQPYPTILGLLFQQGVLMNTTSTIQRNFGANGMNLQKSDQAKGGALCPTTFPSNDRLFKYPFQKILCGCGSKLNHQWTAGFVP